MFRISDTSIARSVLSSILANKEDVNKFGQEVSSGVKVNYPGDSDSAGTISNCQEAMRRVDGYQTRITQVQSSLGFQADLLTQAQETLTRAKELAAQGANESTANTRTNMAKEVFELRNQIVSLANTQYQGKYIYGGASDNNPPFIAATYTLPASGQSSERYVYDATPGSTTTRTVNISDTLSVTTNTPGNQIFSNAVYALERLGRALEGYTTNPATGQPDGTGSAYNQPTDIHLQTQDIAACMDSIQSAVSSDVSSEIANVAGRQRRLDTALAILKATKADGEQVLNNLQKADITESASALTQAQTALQASYVVSSKVMQMSILDFL